MANGMAGREQPAQFVAAAELGLAELDDDVGVARVARVHGRQVVRPDHVQPHLGYTNRGGPLDDYTYTHYDQNACSECVHVITIVTPIKY